MWVVRAWLGAGIRNANRILIREESNWLSSTKGPWEKESQSGHPGSKIQKNNMDRKRAAKGLFGLVWTVRFEVWEVGSPRMSTCSCGQGWRQPRADVHWADGHRRLDSHRELKLRFGCLVLNNCNPIKGSQSSKLQVKYRPELCFVWLIMFS